tara:strand:- start:14283 stop:14861 length:579 start_codon:yes stop_codon:yes gene_type:complete
MWSAYKEQDAEGYMEAIEAAGFEVPEEVLSHLNLSDVDKDGDIDVNDAPVSKETDLFLEYSKTMQQLQRFPHAYTHVQKREMQERLVEIADETRPKNYKCTPTDSWQIWFGPTQQCLLINTSRHLAFTCSRAWWTRRYLNAMYVDRQLVNDAKQIARMRAEYEIRKKLVKRAPLPDVEIMVPTTASEYHMRG